MCRTTDRFLSWIWGEVFVEVLKTCQWWGSVLQCVTLWFCGSVLGVCPKIVQCTSSNGHSARQWTLIAPLQRQCCRKCQNCFSTATLPQMAWFTSGRDSTIERAEVVTPALPYSAAVVVRKCRWNVVLVLLRYCAVFKSDSSEDVTDVTKVTLSLLQFLPCLLLPPSLPLVVVDLCLFLCIFYVMLFYASAAYMQPRLLDFNYVCPIVRPDVSSLSDTWCRHWCSCSVVACWVSCFVYVVFRFMLVAVTLATEFISELSFESYTLKGGSRSSRVYTSCLYMNYYYYYY